MTQDESQKPIKDVEIALRYKAIGLGLQERLKVFSCLTIHKIIFQLLIIIIHLFIFQQLIQKQLFIFQLLILIIHLFIFQLLTLILIIQLFIFQQLILIQLFIFQLPHPNTCIYIAATNSNHKYIYI